MQKAKGNYERTILIITALLAVGAGGWFIHSAMSFPDTLVMKKGVEKPFTGEIPVERIKEAINLAKADPKGWTAPVRGGKPVPLFKSVLLLLKYSEPENVIDMFAENPAIRPPMTNKWLRESSLPKIGENPAYVIPNVGELDADDDGFTNQEEFEKSTNPTSKDSHPPVTDKLFLIERITYSYRLVLRSSSPPFQVATPDDKARRNWFVNEGGRFGAGDRFVAGKLEKKTMPDPRVGEKDVSELQVEDTVRKEKFTLIMGTEKDLPEYEAVFESRLKVREQVKAKKDDAFRIPSWPDTTYKVIDIQEDSAVISPLNDKGELQKQIIIKKG